MLPTIALAALALQGQVRDWPSAGGFDVAQLETGCAISTDYSFDGRGDVELILFFDGDRPQLFLTSSDWSNREGQTYSLSFLLGEAAYEGDASGFVDGPVRKGVHMTFPAKFLDQFAAAPSLAVFRDETVVTNLSLSGSASAIATLRRCSEHVASENAERARREARWDYIAKDPFSVPGEAAALSGSVSVITNPTWSIRPVPDFPERALSRGLASGSVQLDCTASANGSLTDCRVVSEDPAGAGFGQAALAAARRARLSPRTIDDAAPGARIIFSSRFSAQSD